jgi:hypothetical protein
MAWLELFSTREEGIELETLSIGYVDDTLLRRI